MSRRYPSRSTVRVLLALAISVAVAAVIFAVAWTFRDVGFFAVPAEEARDIGLAIRADNVPVQALRAPFVFIKIDDEAFAAMGRQLQTPHGRLAHLLLAVAAARPTLIVLDIDVSWPAGKAQDDSLAAALTSLGKRGTKLLLMREMSVRNLDDAPDRLAASRFDAILARYPWLQWVAISAPSRNDGTVRSLRTWVAACREGKPVLLPGVGLAAVAAYASASGASASGRPAPGPAPDWSCAGAGALAAAAPDAKRSSPLQPIQYSLRWSDNLAVSTQSVVDRNGRTRPLLSVLPAGPLLRADSARDMPSEWIAGSIVVIGGTNVAARDRYPTPLGRMPGAFIVVNHLRGLLDFGPAEEAPWWEGFLTTIVISLITAVASLTLERYLSTWLEVLLPVALTAVWWLLLTLALGGGAYFGFALTQFLVALIVRLVPRGSADAEVKGAA